MPHWGPPSRAPEIAVDEDEGTGRTGPRGLGPGVKRLRDGGLRRYAYCHLAAEKERANMHKFMAPNDTAPPEVAGPAARCLRRRAPPIVVGGALSTN